MPRPPKRRAEIRDPAVIEAEYKAELATRIERRAAGRKQKQIVKAALALAPTLHSGYVPPPPSPTGPPKPPPPPPPDWTFVDRICGSHEKQKRFIKQATAKGARTIACCGRQSGKSRGAFGAVLDVLQKNPGSQALWLGLSAESVDRTVWPSIKKYLRDWGLLDSIKIDNRHHKLTLDSSEAVFLGTDDGDHMESYRGGTNAIVVVDEIQSQPYDLVQGLVEDVLEPSLMVSDGPMLVLGTPPPRRVGWFAQTWFGNNGFNKVTWNGFDNPAVQNFQALLERKAAERGVDWKKDPKIRREYLGEWADDTSNAVLPNFSPVRNVYEPDPANVDRFEHGFALKKGPDGPLGLPRGNWFFAAGIDSGQLDRLAIEVVSWCDSAPGVWHVAEFVAPRDSKMPPSRWVPVVKDFIARYGTMTVYLDPSSISVSALVTDYSLFTTKAAKKVDRPGQLNRMDDLAARSRLRVVAGSKLAEDCVKTQWSTQSNSEGQKVYSKAWKQDALDGFRYALASYFDVAVAEDTRDDITKQRETSQAWIKEQIRKSAEAEADGPTEAEALAAALGYGA